jgi:hypothetical protein
MNQEISTMAGMQEELFQRATKFIDDVKKKVPDAQLYDRGGLLSHQYGVRFIKFSGVKKTPKKCVIVFRDRTPTLEVFCDGGGEESWLTHRQAVIKIAKFLTPRKSKIKS